MSRTWRRPRAVPDDDDQKYREFAGLTNTLSPKDFGFHALAVANNVIGTDSKRFVTRPGYALFRAGAPTTAYVLGDNLYVVESGALLRLASATDAHSLTTGLTGTSYSWDAINGKAYFVNGVNAGIVWNDNYQPLRVTAPASLSITAPAASLPSTVLNFGQKYDTALWRFIATYETADGRESAPSEVVEVWASPATPSFNAAVPVGYARTNVYCTEPDGTSFRLAGSTTGGAVTLVPAQAGRELTTFGTSPLPDGVDVIQYWGGSLYVSQYFAAENTSVIWHSKPFAFHLYDMAEDYIVVPGRVALMLWNNEGLLIGTTDSIYQYGDEGKLDIQVNYGVVPGCAGIVTPESIAYFWTTRGFCKAMPFENLTEKTVGMPPGLWANTSMVYLNGMQQLVTITQGGGSPFNIRS